MVTLVSFVSPGVNSEVRKARSMGRVIERHEDEAEDAFIARVEDEWRPDVGVTVGFLEA
jgi:hypothetical protein